MSKALKVLVACEESQAVCTEMRRLGHEAYSCDILPCSGGHPEWHIQGDCLPLIDGDCEFRTMDGELHIIDGEWDLLIAHPPCTYLTVTGNRWLNIDRYGDKARERHAKREEARCFFMRFASARCEKIAIENPIGYMNTAWRSPDQIVSPWMFGDPTEKKTCIWLKGLKPLKHTVLIKPPMEYHEWTTATGKRKRQVMWYYETRCLPHADRARAASKTFPGIAKAMAEQWAGDAREENPE